MDSTPGNPFDKGKREAEDAIEMEVVSAKKQRVGERAWEIKTDVIAVEEKVEADSSYSQPEQCIKVNVSAEDGHVVSVLVDRSNVLEEDMVAAEKKPAVPVEGHIVAASMKDESNHDSRSCFRKETSLDEDVVATIRAPATLIEEDPPKKKDESNKGSDCSSKDVTILDEDVTGANLSPSAPSMLIRVAPVKKKDDHHSDEFEYAHENNTDYNVATAKAASAAPSEKGPVVAWGKKDESGSDNEKFDEVDVESVPEKKEDESNDELEIDDDTSSSDDDTQTPATPTEQTTSGKTLFVGNLSFSVELEDVEHFFKAAGEVVNIRFGMNTNETFKGYGYVEFASVESAEKAFRELNGKVLLRRRVRLDYAKERGTFTPYASQDTSFRNEGKAQGQTIFVRGFNNDDCEDKMRKSLEEHFGSCGDISRVSVPKNQDGSARGIAYIEFKDRDAFNRALALNGSEFRECTLSVKEAISRGDVRDFAGSGRGYGRNGGRHSWQDSNGRSGWINFGGRSDWRDFSGRRNFGGRNNWQNFSGRSRVYEGDGGRGDWRDFIGRRGVREGGVGRGDWRDFSGRRGVHEGGGGRGDWRGLSGRRGFGDGGRGDWRGFSGRRGVGDGGSGRGEWREFSGRRGVGGRGEWQDFGGRRGWFGGGISGRGGVGNHYFNGRRGGVWFGGGGRGSGRGTPIEEPCIAATAEEPCIAATAEEPCMAATAEEPCMAATAEEPCIAATAEDGNNASLNNEEHVENQMK